jgi:hypothetical protein
MDPFARPLRLLPAKDHSILHHACLPSGEFCEWCHPLPAFNKLSFRDSPLNKAVKLYLSLGRRIGAKPYGSNNHFVSIGNHVTNIDSEIWNLLHQNLKPLRTFLQVVLVVSRQFMIVKIRSHIPENGWNVSTVHGFEVMLYKLPVYACLIHFSPPTGNWPTERSSASPNAMALRLVFLDP